MNFATDAIIVSPYFTAACANEPLFVPNVTMTRIEPKPVVEFIPGRTYSTRSAGDYDCIFMVEVISRTAKSVRIRSRNEKIVTRKIYVYDGVESFKPFGSYSMCAIIRADKFSA